MTEHYGKMTPEEWVQFEHDTHKGEWLSIEAAKDYREKASSLDDSTGMLIGERRRLVMEMVKRFDITEVEALNIMNGGSILDVVNRYNRIRDLIPLDKAKPEKKKKS